MSIDCSLRRRLNRKPFAIPCWPTCNIHYTPNLRGMATGGLPISCYYPARPQLIDYCRHLNGKQGFNPGGSDYFYSTPHRHSQSWVGGGKSKHHHNNNKSNSTAISALTLLTFLFFLNLLQNCLREQMETMNPTVREKEQRRMRMKLKPCFELFSRSW